MATTTYGERLLADAEQRSHRIRQRRRTFVLLGPSGLAVVLATAATLGNRADALGDAGLVRHAVDHLRTLGYVAAFVAAPLAAAVVSVRGLAATVALVAGPVLMPVLLGPGWRIWHRLVVGAACALVIVGARARPRPGLGARRAAPRR